MSDQQFNTAPSAHRRPTFTVEDIALNALDLAGTSYGASIEKAIDDWPHFRSIYHQAFHHLASQLGISPGSAATPAAPLDPWDSRLDHAQFAVMEKRCLDQISKQLADLEWCRARHPKDFEKADVVSRLNHLTSQLEALRVESNKNLKWAVRPDKKPVGVYPRADFSQNIPCEAVFKFVAKGSPVDYYSLGYDTAEADVFHQPAGTDVTFLLAEKGCLVEDGAKDKKESSKLASPAPLRIRARPPFSRQVDTTTKARAINKSANPSLAMSPGKGDITGANARVNPNEATPFRQATSIGKKEASGNQMQHHISGRDGLVAETRLATTDRSLRCDTPSATGSKSKKTEAQCPVCKSTMPQHDLEDHRWSYHLHTDGLLIRSTRKKDLERLRHDTLESVLLHDVKKLNTRKEVFRRTEAQISRLYPAYVRTHELPIDTDEESDFGRIRRTKAQLVRQIQMTRRVLYEDPTWQDELQHLQEAICGHGEDPLDLDDPLEGEQDS